MAANGRPERSIAHSGAGLVHRHDRVAVAGDPAAVAERLVERLAEHDPGVLDRVVRAGLQVAGDLDLEVEPAVAGEQVEHVVEEADAGRARCRRRVPSRPERERDVGLAGRAGDLRRCGSSGRRILADLHRSGVVLEALGAGDRRPGARQRGRRGARRAPRPCGGGSGARTGRRRSGRRRRWAACGSNPPRSRRTRCRTRCPRTGSRRCARAGRAPRRRRRRAGGARARAPRRTPARPRSVRVHGHADVLEPRPAAPRRR